MTDLVSRRPLLVASAALLLGTSAPAFSQTVLFTEDFQDADATTFVPTDNFSERHTPTFYYSDPTDPQWVFFTGTFLAASAQEGDGSPSGNKAVLLNEAPQHALALRDTIAVTPGAPLVLTFEHWGDNRPLQEPYTFEVYADATVIGTVSRSYTVPGPGAAAVFPFFAPSDGTLLLSFRDVSIGDASGIIDNLVLLQIPEPEIFGMMLAGFGLLGFVARRRSRLLRAA
jgi:hypothetical protein